MDSGVFYWLVLPPPRYELWPGLAAEFAVTIASPACDCRSFPNPVEAQHQVTVVAVECVPKSLNLGRQMYEHQKSAGTRKC
jgi:hypothetical protein